MGLFTALYLGRAIEKHAARQTREIRAAIEPEPVRAPIEDRVVAWAAIITFWVMFLGLAVLLAALNVDSGAATVLVVVVSFLCSAAVAGILAVK